ncbi:MAG: PP2C family protein-serine/threonine phosphatase [bacterium]|nr:PP2C family protein-serine/threonine phosphatase [bacterium]
MKKQALAMNSDITSSIRNLKYFAECIQNERLGHSSKTIIDKINFTYDKKTKIYKYLDKSSLRDINGKKYALIAVYWGNEKLNKDEKTINAISNLRVLQPQLEQYNISHNSVLGTYICFKDKGLIGYIQKPEKYYELCSNQYFTNSTNTVKNLKFEPGIPVFTNVFKNVVNELVLNVIYPIFDLNNELYCYIGFVYSYDSIMSNIFNIFLEAEYKNYDFIKLFITNYGNTLFLPAKTAKLLSLPFDDKVDAMNSESVFNVNLFMSKNPEVRKLGHLIINNDSGIKQIKLNGDNYLVIFDSLPINKWNITLFVKYSSLYSPVYNVKYFFNKISHKFFIYFIVSFSILLIAGLIISFVIFKKLFIIPVERLRNNVKLLGKGKFKLKIKEGGTKEIFDLTQSFNNLGLQLDKFTENLKKEVKSRQSIETELKIAGEIQNSVLPDITDEFKRNEFELYAKLISAKEMSGDFYDFFFVTEKELAIVLADVSGKGITAAFFMSMSKAIIKERCLKTKPGLNPGKILDYVNKTLCRDNDSSMFLTMYLGVYNIETGKLRYANAGHHEFIYMSSTGKTEPSGILNNLAIGLHNGAEYKNASVVLKPGSSVIFYTDGITEAPDTENNEYGNEKLEKLLSKKCNLEISDLGDAVIDDVLEYQNGDKFDDITLLILKRK